jgi:multiple antibiotic resistance protein
MMSFLKPYVLAFIPIFVAVDAIGNIPLFVALTEGINRRQRKTVIVESVSTAAAMAVLFMLIGKWVFLVLGITISDFQIAGGGLLFIIALRLLFTPARSIVSLERHSKDIGVFPLGTPLITGPAVLTTTLMMLDSHGLIPTFISLSLNMLIVWITLEKAEVIMGFFGAAGTRAFSKIMYILLAAIGVMLMRRGIVGVLGL